MALPIVGRIATPNPSAYVAGSTQNYTNGSNGYAGGHPSPSAPLTGGGLPVVPVSGQAINPSRNMQYGLAGSEAALTGGMAGAQSALSSGALGAESALYGGMAGAEGAINSALGTSIGIGNQAYQDAATGINQGYDKAAAGLAAYQNAMNDRSLSLNTSLNSESVDAINKGVASFDSYSQGGSNAQKLYDDLTGVNGQQAQAAAQAAYQSSPALQYQMEQMQKQVERSAAAKGGLLSGRAMLELQRNAQGLASQDYFKNLGAIGESANRGLSAASQIGNLRSSQAQMGAQLQGIGLQAQAQYEAQKEQIRADIASKISSLSESRGLNLGAMRTALGQGSAAATMGAAKDIAGIRSNTAGGIADIRFNAGSNLAGMKYGFGQDVATGRSAAGQAIAQNATQAATNISNMLNQQGIGVSDMMNKDISSITDMIYQSGMQDKVDMQNLAALIANINGGQATNVMQGNQAIGAAQAAGQLGIGNAAQNAMQQGIQLGAFGKQPVNYNSAQYNQSFNEMPFNKG